MPPHTIAGSWQLSMLQNCARMVPSFRLGDVFSCSSRCRLLVAFHEGRLNILCQAIYAKRTRKRALLGRVFQMGGCDMELIAETLSTVPPSHQAYSAGAPSVHVVPDVRPTRNAFPSCQLPEHASRPKHPFEGQSCMNA